MVRLSVHTIEFKLSLSHTHTPCRFSIIIRLLGVITNQALHRRRKKRLVWVQRRVLHISYLLQCLMVCSIINKRTSGVERERDKASVYQSRCVVGYLCGQQEPRHSSAHSNSTVDLHAFYTAHSARGGGKLCKSIPDIDFPVLFFSSLSLFSHTHDFFFF